MAYFQVVLTDDNFDEELEKLCKYVGLPYSSYNSFAEKLDDDFSLQVNNGVEEWIKSEVYPNKGSDFRQAYQVGQLAYEFSNGFIILDYETLL